MARGIGIDTDFGGFGVGVVNLGNVTGLIKSITAPTKKYVLWGKIINPTFPDIVQLQYYNGSGWVPLGGGGSRYWLDPVRALLNAPMDSGGGFGSGDETDLEPETPLNVDDRFLVGPAPTGAFTGQANKIATYDGNGYRFDSPPDNAVLYVGEGSKLLAYGAGAWREVGGGGGGKFKEDLLLNMPPEAWLGIWKTGQTVPLAGLDLDAGFKVIGQAALPPIVTLGGTAGVQPFNQTDVNTTLTWSYTLKTLGATLGSMKLERGRNGGGWVTLFNTATPPNNYVDNGLNTTANNANIDYRLTVTDSAGAVGTAGYSITFSGYVAPSKNLSVSNAGERIRGDIRTELSGNIVRNSPNVFLESYQLQYQAVNAAGEAGQWTNLGDEVAISGNSASIVSYVHNDAQTHGANELVDSNSISYRVLVRDTQGESGTQPQTVTLVYESALGYSANPDVTLAEYLAFANRAVTNGKGRTIGGVTATGSQYTYYLYAASAGDLTGVIMDGASPVLGALRKQLPDVTGLNDFGATLVLRAYRSNALGAFNNNSLAFA